MNFIRRLREFVELTKFLEQSKDPTGFRLVQSRKCKPNVNEDVVPRHGLGNVFEARRLSDAAEIDLCHEHAVLVVRLDHFPWYTQTHAVVPIQAASAAATAN
jgi:hypothetical protein